MLDDYLPTLADFDTYMARFFQALAQIYRERDFVNLSGDFLYSAYRERRPPDDRVIPLIGISFRLSTANMVFTSDVINNSGYIKPRDVTLSTDSILDVYRKRLYGVSFENYFDKLYVPYFRSRGTGATRESLIAGSSLKRIESYLRKSNKIALMTNADDIILAPGEIDYLRDVFGARATIYPRGGHCGNLEFRDNVAHMINFFAN
jgi:hypothetical protein